MTALDLQTDERLDMAEVALACEAAGKTLYTIAVSDDRYDPFNDHDWEWDGVTDDGRLAFALRDAVRKVAPGSYCIPVSKHHVEFCGPFRVSFRNAWGLFPNDADADDLRWRQMPRGLYGRTETECWARALVALYRAGLLGSVA